MKEIERYRTSLQRVKNYKIRIEVYFQKISLNSEKDGTKQNVDYSIKPSQVYFQNLGKLGRIAYFYLATEIFQSTNLRFTISTCRKILVTLFNEENSIRVDSSKLAALNRTEQVKTEISQSLARGVYREHGAQSLLKTFRPRKVCFEDEKVQLVRRVIEWRMEITPSAKNNRSTFAQLLFSASFNRSKDFRLAKRKYVTDEAKNSHP